MELSCSRCLSLFFFFSVGDLHMEDDISSHRQAKGGCLQDIALVLTPPEGVNCYVDEKIMSVKEWWPSWMYALGICLSLSWNCWWLAEKMGT
jgi:hypothetical protein